MNRIIAICLFTCSVFAVMAQDFNVKTNLLYDATATINLGAEVKLNNKSTIDVSGSYNNWTFSDNKKWKHWTVQPEYRYWLCESFNGSFFGVHALVGQFNFNKVKLPFGLYPDLQNYNYQGDFFGGGLSYGYQWILSNRWALELSVGAGYLYINYDKYPCNGCGTKLDEGHENYVGITKAEVGVVYFIH